MLLLPQTCLITPSGASVSVSPAEASPGPLTSSAEPQPPASPRRRRHSERYCQLCNAWFNNPSMAQQHYQGKKHAKNAARAHLLEQLGHTPHTGQEGGTAGAGAPEWEEPGPSVAGA